MLQFGNLRAVGCSLRWRVSESCRC